MIRQCVNEMFRSASVPLMLRYLRDVKNGAATLSQLHDVFGHPDYAFEFERYNVTEMDNICHYFQNINRLTIDEIPDFTPDRPDALRDKHSLWMEAFENPGHYERLYDEVTNYMSAEKMAQAYQRALYGLPANTDIPRSDIITTMSIGGSFGYFHQNNLHFDLMGIEKHCRISALPAVIAHERHHAAMMPFVSQFMHHFTAEELFIFRFSGEGLAVKFCNNAAGFLSKPIDQNAPINEGLDAFTWSYLNSRFKETLFAFVDTLKGIRNGTLAEEALSAQIQSFWWNTYTDEQSKSEPPKLAHSRMYTFGNDLYGVIYDCFGHKTLFDCVRRPLKAIQRFREAIRLTQSEQSELYQKLLEI